MLLEALCLFRRRAGLANAHGTLLVRGANAVVEVGLTHRMSARFTMADRLRCVGRAWGDKDSYENACNGTCCLQSHNGHQPLTV